jgi:hypothetical protein
MSAANHGLVQSMKQMTYPGNRLPSLQRRAFATCSQLSRWIRVLQNSVRSGDVVFDPFGGSGSTLSLLKRTEATADGISPTYCDVIIKRWQDFTGKQAVHAETGETFNASR